MLVTFFGAVGEVTGSMHLLSVGKDRILLDCGMFQGRRKETTEKNRVLPFEPGKITNLVLSHAHIDHSGRIPLLVKKGFSGRVICTRATADACRYLLADSGHIQESDADYLNYKTVRALLEKIESEKKSSPLSDSERKKIRATLKKNRYALNRETIEKIMEVFHLEKIEPLYSKAEAETSLSAFDGFPYNESVRIGEDVTVTLFDAGHILGSAFCFVQAKRNGSTMTIAFSGDVGRFGKPIIRDPTLRFPEHLKNVDLLIMESTYGDRVHEDKDDLKGRLTEILSRTFERGGSVVIPSFAFGRAQEVVYLIHELYDEGALPKVPVFVDSPLAVNMTRVFGEHPEIYDRETHETFLQKKENPFMFSQIRYSSTVQESMALMEEKRPHIVLSSSGMCEAGRILHHLRYKIHNPANTILIVGYMARNTLGRRILENGTAFAESGRKGDPPLVRILNKEYPLKASVEKIGGFSGHADRNELLRFVKQSNLNVREVALVHGEPDQTAALAATLKKEHFSVLVPSVGETIHIQG